MLFDQHGQIKRYDSPEAILADFFDLRLDFYERRRVALLEVGGGGFMHAPAEINSTWGPPGREVHPQLPPPPTTSPPPLPAGEQTPP